MLTDDARVLDSGQCQVEAWGLRQQFHTERWALPACGVGAGREWALGGGRQYDDGSASGLYLLQVKQVWQDLRPGGLGMALSVGRQGVGTNWTSVLNLPVTWLSFDERSLVHLNLGLMRNGQFGRRQLPWGLALERRLTAPLWLIAERHATTRDRWLLQAGIRWWIVPDKLQVDATLGRQREGAHSHPTATFGVRWIFAEPARLHSVQ